MTAENEAPEPSTTQLPPGPQQHRDRPGPRVEHDPGAAPRPRVREEDLAVLADQLGREPRGVVEIAARCVCGRPTVVRTAPRLADGTPFPTSYYLTHPGAVSAVSTLEAGGLMAQMTERLAREPGLAAAHLRAHQDYLERRAELGEVPEIAGISAGGMPSRVKCLHVLVAHALARGPGVNPLGDEALAAMAASWRPGRCTC
ncbi:DUF501 domain-containing protein [Serinibacter salmoneus]|uniref:DUF501 domain-containing protein n=1 Tax=Serinibacter salmoneus TaxID=556530 RepID=A0A2A9D3C2_9MICO|nr:DUF501 domain-containing protein [Serinibacter salmoneus]PFG20452.1 hypothetical protein ATL40_2052 [Serinibacter salmoneus]